MLSLFDQGYVPRRLVPAELEADADIVELVGEEEWVFVGIEVAREIETGRVEGDDSDPA